MSARVILILGGARSGKSNRAEYIATASSSPVVYVATYANLPQGERPAQSDPEMDARIARHRSQRPPHWRTIENRFDLAAILAEHPGHTVLLDCLTLWLSFHFGTSSEEFLLGELRRAIDAARTHQVTLIMVSNELGMGLVPSSEAARSFRDLCGRANQQVASEADVVEFQIAGLPLPLKGGRLS